MKEEKYFAGNAMVGNTCKKGYKSLNEGEEVLVKCFDKYPNEKEKHLKTLRILAKIHKFNFTEHPTIEQTEEAAQLCEEYLEIFPVLHPDKDLTRKQFVLGIILPIFIHTALEAVKSS